MSQYSTHIVVPGDRCIHFYIPIDFPIGPARITIEPLDARLHADISEVNPAPLAPEPHSRRSILAPENHDDEHHEIEWWEEFEEDETDMENEGL